MTQAGSTDDLVETLLRWCVDDASSADVVRGAARSAADDDAPEWVIALACLPSDASAHDIEDVLERTTPELPVPVVPRGNPEAVLAAALAMVRRCVAGHLAERDLARWMHTFVGHDWSEELERLVTFDDVYDTVEYSSDTIGSVDAQVRAEASRLLRLHSPELSVGRSDTWRGVDSEHSVAVSERDEERFERAVHENVKAVAGGVAVVLPGMVLPALGASQAVVVGYLLVITAALAAVVLLRRFRGSSSR